MLAGWTHPGTVLRSIHSWSSTFQVNAPGGTDRAPDCGAACGANGDGPIIDFCGVSAISLPLASRVGWSRLKSSSSIAQAQANAANSSRARVRGRDVAILLQAELKSYFALVVDPPRGVGPEVVKQSWLNATLLAYLNMMLPPNPDLRQLLAPASGYALERLQPVVLPPDHGKPG